MQAKELSCWHETAQVAIGCTSSVAQLSALVALAQSRLEQLHPRQPGRSLGCLLNFPKRSLRLVLSFLSPRDLARLDCGCKSLHHSTEAVVREQARNLYGSGRLPLRRVESWSWLLHFVSQHRYCRPLGQGAIAAGYSHSLLVTRTGALHTFGHGDHGVLGHDDIATQTVPTKVALFEGVRVAVVSASFRCHPHNYSWNTASPLSHTAHSYHRLPPSPSPPPFLPPLTSPPSPATH
jgi:hypothetical protein